MAKHPLIHSAPLLALIAVGACSPVPEELRERARITEFNYPAGPVARACAPGERAGEAGGSDGEQTPGGREFNVRTPANYRAEVAHPLLIVYAAAGMNGTSTELRWGLTREATAAGYIVAYPDHGIGPSASEDLGKVAGLVAARWCVDERRVFLAGHSDGGLASTAVAFLDATRGIPAAIAPSGAGIRREDLIAYDCPGPLPVMVLHSADDELFPIPRYGLSVVKWWAQCNGCDSSHGEPDENGCVSYENCAAGAPTLFCKGRGMHARFPPLREAIIAFFAAAPDNRDVE